MDSRRFGTSRLLDQNFGLCISSQDYLYPFLNLYGANNYYRPWRWYMQRSLTEFGSTIQDQKDQFEITLDVQHFKPEEISVKVTDTEVTIEGKHEEKQDIHGFISRQFKRRYFLPKECNPDTVVSSLSSDGVLIVIADKSKSFKSKEIIIPIKICDSYINKDSLKIKNETKLFADKNKKLNNEASKKNMALMLKEDHCCSIKPELLDVTAAPPIGTEKITKQTDSKLDDMLLTSTTKIEQQSDMESKEKIKEEFGASDAKMAIEQMAATSKYSKSKMANVTSMISETFESSKFASMSSSVKETTEKISEIVSDISAQLREAAETI